MLLCRFQFCYLSVMFSCLWLQFIHLERLLLFKLLIRALHFLSSLSFCCSSVCCCCLAARDTLYAALADLTLETILGVIGNFNTSIPALQIASYTTLWATTVFSSMLNQLHPCLLRIHLPPQYSHVTLEEQAWSPATNLCYCYCCAPNQNKMMPETFVCYTAGISFCWMLWQWHRMLETVTGCHNQISLTTQIPWPFPEFVHFPWLFSELCRITWDFQVSRNSRKVVTLYSHFSPHHWNCHNWLHSKHHFQQVRGGMVNIRWKWPSATVTFEKCTAYGSVKMCYFW